jgi:hypothetical protein
MDKEWMSVAEVIDHVMRTQRVSRTKARKMVVAAMKKNKLPYRQKMVLEPIPKPLSPEEAVKAFDEDPSELYIPLSEFTLRANFTKDELLGELRSGRLVASATDNTLVKTELAGGKALASDFVVDYQAIINWMVNPKTPRHLVEKFSNTPRQQ